MSGDLPVYSWFDQAPDHYKTRRQLAEQGLRPGGPVVARVVWRKGKAHADLYDLNAAKPKREMTEAQRAALKKAQEAQRTCPNCKTVLDFVLPWRWDPWHDCPVCYPRWLAAERADAARTAAIWLRSPRTVILDTETTDLDGYLVQIAVIQATDGAVLLDTLVNPEQPISVGARRIHGITDEMVASAPTFAQLAEQLLGLLRGRRVVTYNKDFDYGVLYRELQRPYGPAPKTESGYEAAVAWSNAYEAAYKRARAELRPRRWRCAMHLYAQFCCDWSDYHGDFRWQPLPGGDHTALGDARACREVLQWMADRPRIEDELNKEEANV